MKYIRSINFMHFKKIDFYFDLIIFGKIISKAIRNYG